ncbi:hypothetical protein BJ1_gp69 [Halorubrum virus BJ1]|uniref:Uncharacterized protein n=1 Tax=Halorubrum virus BJ1 TaxID=416419 RepID=A0ZYT2_9CAUD|nr:hypothetical protein BJ1_gp69 [Halorubrum virus BJ1]CAL92491.1 hypothetical protein [Halorubrum virus BJ1]
MGIRRRLSHLWKETRDGILRGPGVDVETVEADDATINSRDANAFVTGIDGSGKKVQHGESTVTGPNGASDATWDTFSSAQDEIIFDEAFGNTPSVAHMKAQQNGAELVTNIRNISATAMEFEKVNFSTIDFSQDVNTTYWIAVGEE